LVRGTTANNLSLLAARGANRYNSFTDNSAPTGNVYYRIAIADGPACIPGLRTSAAGTEGSITSNIASNILGDLNQAEMKVFPNPSDGAGTVLIEAGRPDTYVLRVLDMLGRTVELSSAQPNTEVKIGEVLIPGMYTVEAIAEDGTRMVRIWVKR
jgi:hypothetical protein